ncbi:MAG: secretin N-terminal domain-containing protein [Candidatus Ozemobacteraceae bacterium]
MNKNHRFRFALISGITLSAISFSGPLAAVDAGVKLIETVASSPIPEGKREMPPQSPVITLVVRNMPTETAVTQIGTQFGLQVVSQQTLEGMVNLDLHDATLDEAISKAVGGMGLDWMVEGKRLHIFPSRQPWAHVQDVSTGPSIPLKEVEPPVSKVIPLSKRKAEEIQKILKDLDPHINAVADSPTNALVLLGTREQIAEAEDLIKKLDEMPAIANQATPTLLLKKVEYLTEVFTLEHVDFEALGKELENIIPRQGGIGGQGSTGSTGMMQAGGRDKDGKPIDMEYFIVEKERRIILVHATEEKLGNIRMYFAKINKPLAQVLIEAQIVAIDSDFERNLGVKWNTLIGFQGPESPWSSAGNPSPVQPGEGILDGPQAFQYGKWNLTNLQGILNTAETQNRAQVLSRPRITAMTGKKALIHIGKELPYVTARTLTDGGNTTENVEFKQVGIKLEVTPVINLSNRTIRLLVKPEVSDSISTAKNGAPIISTRTSESTIEMKSGETMVIGGLLTNEGGKEKGGVPFLEDVPAIGAFFKFSKKTRKKTNLMILLTTRLIDNDFPNTVEPDVIGSISKMLGEPGAQSFPIIASMAEHIATIQPVSSQQLGKSSVASSPGIVTPPVSKTVAQPQPRMDKSRATKEKQRLYSRPLN